MRKFIAVSVSALSLFFGCFFAACSGEQKPAEEPTPLTMQDCFKDFVTTTYLDSTGYHDKPYSGEHVVFSELMKSENNVEPGLYSTFLIYTTEKASNIEVTSISFDVVVEQNCLIQFSLQLSENNTLYSDNSVQAEAGTPSTIMWSTLRKRWTAEEAGNSELRSGWMIGKASTYLKLEPIGKETLKEINYSICNLKIEFTEFK